MMGNEHVIEVSHISKRFKTYYDKGYNLKEKIIFKNRNRFEWHSVLEDISFQVDKGEAVALIGHNGCGKSTMLKLLTRIMYPNSGSISIQGRVSSLIELGAGFHPDMSGRENIYINASIFGLSRKEIDRRLEDIIAFSELENYIDNPVRTYSSGMYMRLAFSVAINVDADVLLVDEILAVGDANFQKKCFRKMRELKASGITIVIVTHDLGMVESFCDRAIWINDCKIAEMNRAQETVRSYTRYMSDLQYAKEREHEVIEQAAEQSECRSNEERLADAQATNTEAAAEETVVEESRRKQEYPMPSNVSADATHHGMMDVVISKAYWRNEHQEQTATLRSGEPAILTIEYEIKREIDSGLVFGIAINTLEKNCIYGVNTMMDEVRLDEEKKTGKLSCRFDKLELYGGKYEYQVAVHGLDGTPFDFYDKYGEFVVVTEQRFKGVMQIAHRWIAE